MNYTTLITGKRRRGTTVSGRDLSTETESDRGRVLFSAAFRRLQQKTQVFPLEDNAAVRSRLTHSLEVAYLGRLIGLNILSKAGEARLRDWGLSDRPIPFLNIIETACLVHDIGNPPFGHFGEHAIQKWFGKNGLKLFNQATGRSDTSESPPDILYDFSKFDGNAQGFRILTRLQWNKDEFGLNLTHSQLATFLKYVCPPHETNEKEAFREKPSYFYSERDIVSQVWRELGLPRGQRFPLTYVVEAADDIAYCLSDIEDGLEKRIITEEQFKQELSHLWKEYKPRDSHDKVFDGIFSEQWEWRPGEGASNDRFFSFKTDFTRRLTDEAASNYVQHHEDILQGRAEPLLKLSPQYKAALKALKTFAQRHVFKSRDAEHLELAGFQIVTGLLDHFQPLLVLSKEDFDSVAKQVRKPNTDLERRLYNLLPRKHVLVYKHALENPGDHDLQPAVNEWFARAHLVTDFISGMTDRYALELYQILSGIRT